MLKINSTIDKVRTHTRTFLTSIGNLHFWRSRRFATSTVHLHGPEETYHSRATSSPRVFQLSRHPEHRSRDIRFNFHFSISVCRWNFLTGRLVRRQIGNRRRKTRPTFGRRSNRGFKFTYIHPRPKIRPASLKINSRECVEQQAAVSVYRFTTS